MDLHTWISIMEIWSSVANCGNPPLWGLVAFGIPSAPYFVVKLFICLRNSNKCPHINPDMWCLNFRNYTALQPDYSLYIWLIYSIVKITKNIWVLSSRWMAIYRVGSINFDVALISCLRGKLTGWLALIPKTTKHYKRDPVSIHTANVIRVLGQTWRTHYFIILNYCC